MVFYAGGFQKKKKGATASFLWQRPTSTLRPAASQLSPFVAEFRSGMFDELSGRAGERAIRIFMAGPHGLDLGFISRDFMKAGAML